MRPFRSLGQPVLPGQNVILRPQFQLGPPSGGGFASPYGGVGPIGAWNEPAPKPLEVQTVPASVGPIGGTTILQQPSIPVSGYGPAQEALQYLTPETAEFGGYPWPVQPELPQPQWSIIQPTFISQPVPTIPAPSVPASEVGPSMEPVQTPLSEEEEEFPWWILFLVLGSGALIYEMA